MTDMRGIRWILVENGGIWWNLVEFGGILPMGDADVG